MIRGVSPGAWVFVFAMHFFAIAAATTKELVVAFGNVQSRGLPHLRMCVFYVGINHPYVCVFIGEFV